MLREAIVNEAFFAPPPRPSEEGQARRFNNVTLPQVIGAAGRAAQARQRAA
jgi:hypothetical protein